MTMLQLQSLEDLNSSRNILVTDTHIVVEYPKKVSCQRAWKHLMRHYPDQLPWARKRKATNPWTRRHDDNTWRWEAKK